MSTDPLFKSYPWYTPYQFAGNKPIIAIDLDGLEELIRINFYDIAGNFTKAAFIPLSSKETAEAFTDIWADINGLGQYRKPGSKDKFTSSNSVMATQELKDYNEGNILSKHQEYKAPYIGQLTIDVKPGSEFLYSLSYTEELIHDKEYDKYKSNTRKNTFFDLGYLISNGLSDGGKYVENAGVAASLTLGPEVGGPMIGFGGGMGLVGDGLDLGLDYLRSDYDLANKKLLLFGVERVFDKALGEAAKLAPSQKSKTDVFGVTIGNGADGLRDNLSQNTKLIKSKKADTKKSLEVLKNL